MIPLGVSRINFKPVKRIFIIIKKIFRAIDLDWNKNTNYRRYSTTEGQNSEDRKSMAEYKVPFYLKAKKTSFQRKFSKKIKKTINKKIIKKNRKKL